MDQQLKDAKWVAETLGLPLQRIYDLTRKKVIPAVRILRQYRYDPEALSEWAKRGGTSAKNETGEVPHGQR
jgi:excisionase family DNA binding protein